MMFKKYVQLVKTGNTELT